MTLDAATALLGELVQEFRRGGIVEAPIEAPGEHVDGLCEGQRIFVNPAPQTVETLLHELLHRRYPRWGEKRVDKTTKRLVYYMDANSIQTWHRRFKRAARKRSRPIRLED